MRKIRDAGLLDLH